MTHHDRGNPNLDPEEDLAKNREFYRLQDVRPPYTYAALIRQVSSTLADPLVLLIVAGDPGGPVPAADAPRHLQLVHLHLLLLQTQRGQLEGQKKKNFSDLIFTRLLLPKTSLPVLLLLRVAVSRECRNQFPEFIGIAILAGAVTTIRMQ